MTVHYNSPSHTVCVNADFIRPFEALTWVTQFYDLYTQLSSLNFMAIWREKSFALCLKRLKISVRRIELQFRSDIASEFFNSDF